MKIIRWTSTFVLSSLALLALLARADVQTSTSFRYLGGVPDFLASGRIFAAWNPLLIVLGAYLFSGAVAFELELQARGTDVSIFLLDAIPYVVVLAVPHPAVAGILAARGEQLAGKIVVDPTNPVDFETFDGLVVPADSSKAAEIAAALPSSKVVKAFNTNFAATLVAGTVGINPTTVLLAGDDAVAKATVASIVTDGGLAVIDAGSLRRARELEAVGSMV